jgi:hypothetical protein
MAKQLGISQPAYSKLEKSLQIKGKHLAEILNILQLSNDEVALFVQMLQTSKQNRSTSL